MSEVASEQWGWESEVRDGIGGEGRLCRTLQLMEFRFIQSDLAGL